MAIASGPGFLTPYESPRQLISLFQQRLPTNDGQLHFMCPAGVGDNLWIVSKLWRICQERDVTFWLPDSEQKRSGDLFRMMGLRYGYLPGLTTEWIWSRPGEPPIPDAGAVLSIQPNRHLEHGHRIEKWYPELQFRNPVEFMDQNVAGFKLVAGRPKYVIGFTSQLGYMEHGGNLKAAQWARIFRQIEKDVAPVVIIGLGKDVPFVEEVLKFFDPSLEPVFNASLDTIAALFGGAQMVVGAHAGPLILSTYMGIPTLHAYPRWLAPMPGTWEHEEAVWGACFLDELENVVREGITFMANDDAERLRRENTPRIRTLGHLHPRWRREKPQNRFAESRAANGGFPTEEEIREGASCG